MWATLASVRIKSQSRTGFRREASLVVGLESPQDSATRSQGISSVAPTGSLWHLSPNWDLKVSYSVVQWQQTMRRSCLSMAAACAAEKLNPCRPPMM
jgi:hypothetical protein